MPLSEHEQRLLEQIEQALYADDPKFAQTYGSRDLRAHYRRRLLRGVGLFVFGVLLLAAGFALPARFGRQGWSWAFTGAGLVMMFLASAVTLAASQRITGRWLPPTPWTQSGIGRRRPAGGRRLSIVARLDERWQRRWENRRF